APGVAGPGQGRRWTVPASRQHPPVPGQRSANPPAPPREPARRGRLPGARYRVKADASVLARAGRDLYGYDVTSVRTVRRPGRTAAALLRYAPWSARSWHLTTGVLTGGVVGILTGAVVLLLALLTAVLAVTVVFGAGSLLLLVGCVHAFAVLQRSRLAGLLGVRIPPPPARAYDTWYRGLLGEARSPYTWRQF